MKSGNLRFRRVVIDSNGRQINVRIRRGILDAWIEGRELPPDDPVPESHREEMIMVPVGRRAVFIQEADYLAIVNASKLVSLNDPANDLVSWIIEGATDDPEGLVHLAAQLAENQKGGASE
jgi:hypothetical protein